jgi:FeS assembly SUF system regulator
MLRLSRMTDYACVILSNMAREPFLVMSSSHLSEMTCLPEPSVAKILKLLAKASLVSSIRGASGGYKLEVDPQSISIGAIVEAIEGPVALTACVEDSHQPCAIRETCHLQGKWSPLNNAIRQALQSVNLMEIMKQDPKGAPCVTVKDFMHE